MTIHNILSAGIEKKASDIHLVANKNPMLRIDGKLIETDLGIMNAKKIEELIMSMLTPQQQETYTKERELDFSYSVDDGNRFRVNLHWEKNNPGLVARLISNQVPNLQDLGAGEVIINLARSEEGLVLVTGPTGSGKSTTLAAMVELINTERACHIITLEDPIEFIYTSKKSIIKQRQLGSDMLSFGEGLKHILRQDPNVILIGEMRDLETIAAAITIAETGHFVLATLHTNSAAHTVERIIDVFPPYQQNQVRLQVANTLKGVISQRLLPKKDGGRIATREVMICNPAIANLIRENKLEQIRSVMQTSRDAGMITMDQDIKRLLEEKVIEEQVAKAHMLSPESLAFPGLGA